MELILQRETIKGEELARRGLVNKAFKPDQDVVLEAKKLAARIAAYSRPVVRMAKQAVLAGTLLLTSWMRPRRLLTNYALLQRKTITWTPVWL